MTLFHQREEGTPSHQRAISRKSLLQMWSTRRVCPAASQGLSVSRGDNEDFYPGHWQKAFAQREVWSGCSQNGAVLAWFWQFSFFYFTSHPNTIQLKMQDKYQNHSKLCRRLHPDLQRATSVAILFSALVWEESHTRCASKCASFPFCELSSLKISWSEPSLPCPCPRPVVHCCNPSSHTVEIDNAKWNDVRKNASRLRAHLIQVLHNVNVTADSRSVGVNLLPTTHAPKIIKHL